MDCISNANHATGMAYLYFDSKPDGTFEARYLLMGLMEGLVTPGFLKDHFQLNDFTPFHDEIRKVTDNFLVGKYITSIPPALASLNDDLSLGIFHTAAGGQFGFYYMLTKTDKPALSTTTVLRPFLDVYLPDGLGMRFSEEMVGWYFEGATTPAPGRAGDLTIGQRIPTTGTPACGVDCKFDVNMTVREVNEFIEGLEDEGALDGTIPFGQFLGASLVTFPVDAQNSRFNYLEVIPATGEAEMRYHLEFSTPAGRHFYLDGIKYMQRDPTGKLRGPADVLQDYTTLYAHIYERKDGQPDTQVGLGYLKFRTFEDLAAVGNMVGFLASFQVTGTNDPLLQLQARMRFLAFTAQFVQVEYDPLALPTAT